MNESTVTKMKQMKLYGMHNAFKTAIESGKTDHYTLTDDFGGEVSLTQEQLLVIKEALESLNGN